MQIKLICISLFIFCCSFLWTSDVYGQDLSDTLQTDTTSIVPISPSAISETVLYDAKDSIKIDNLNELIYLYGDAIVEYEDIKLEAPFIEIDMKKNELFAYGTEDSLGNYIKPVFSDANSTFKSENIRYNFDTKKGKINQVITSESGGYLHGENVKMNEKKEIFVQNGKYTTCEAEHPHFHLQASKIKVLPQDKIVVGPSYLVISDIPTPLFIPFAILPNKKERASGLVIPTFGGNNAAYGFSLQRGGYYWAINDYMNLELTGDIYSMGSWGVHAKTNYKKRYKRDGSFQTDFIQMKQGDPEISDEFEKKYDFKIRWTHRQNPKASPLGTFSANVNFGTAGYNQNELTTQMSNDRLRASTNSNITYAFNIPNSPFSGALSASHSQNNLTGDMNITLPNFSLNMSRIYLRREDKVIGKPKWYQNFNMSYQATGKNSTNINDSLLNPEYLDLIFTDLNKGIRHSIPIQGNIKSKYFNITPSARFNSYWYFDYATRDSIHHEFVDQNGFQIGNDFNLSMNFQTVIYGDYIPVGKKKRITKIRHVMTPNIGLTYRPDFTSEGLQKFSGYREAFDTLSQSYYYNIFQGNVVQSPHQGKTGAVSFSLNNTVQMKVRAPKDTLNEFKKVSIFDRLNVGSSYNFFADSLNLAPVSIRGNSTIIKGLSLNFGATLDPYQVIVENNRAIRINQFQWQQKGEFLRLTNSNIGLRWSIKPKADKENQGVMMKKLFADDYMYYQNNPDLFIDFNIPWSINFNYNLNFVQKIEEGEIIIDYTQTLNFSGDVRVSEGWKVGYNSGYDFINKGITSNTRFSLNRNLHCWEMSLIWVPFGPRANYMFSINAKSSMLQDLKLNRRKTSGDYGEL